MTSMLKKELRAEKLKKLQSLSTGEDPKFSMKAKNRRLFGQAAQQMVQEDF